MRQNVIWAYRLFLNREPNSEELEALSRAGGVPQLRSIMTSSQQFATLLARSGRRFKPAYPVDFDEGIRCGYSLLLGREASEEEVAGLRRPEDSIAQLRLRLVTLREFEKGGGDALPLHNFAIVNAFAPFKPHEPKDGSFRDFVGTSTSVRYLPNNIKYLSGHVFSSIAHSFHGTAEWVGTLRSVLDAGDSFTVIELGAGWAPWLASAGAAARMRGIDDLRLIGVEASTEHFGYMVEHLKVNGFAPDICDLHHAAAAPEDGWADFPKLHVANEDFGASAVFEESERTAAATRGDLERVKAISLASLLAGHERVDLIHIDIQGHEEGVLRAALPQLEEKVRRLVIGTHSRSIEGHLIDMLSPRGWVCEYEQPCILATFGDEVLHLTGDGEQIWSNPRVPSFC